MLCWELRAQSQRREGTADEHSPGKPAKPAWQAEKEQRERSACRIPPSESGSEEELLHTIIALAVPTVTAASTPTVAGGVATHEIVTWRTEAKGQLMNNIQSTVVDLPETRMMRTMWADGAEEIQDFLEPRSGSSGPRLTFRTCEQGGQRSRSRADIRVHTLRLQSSHTPALSQDRPS